MNPWLIHPVWQSHASLARECTQASEENSEFLKYHHLTSALYYSITFVEAFLNEQMRRKMEKEGKPETEIYATLRSPTRGFRKKFIEWPTLISGKEITTDDALKNKLFDYNEIRGNLTHPKTRGLEIYEELEKIDPTHLFLSITQYAVQLLEALDCEFPYWYFGWNYILPEGDSSSLSQISNQQFLHSLEYFGVKTNAFIAPPSKKWRRDVMTNWQGYEYIHRIMQNFPDCEPEDDQYPLKPRLCRKWWDAEYCNKVLSGPVTRTPPLLVGKHVVSGQIIALHFHSENEKHDPKGP